MRAPVATTRPPFRFVEEVVRHELSSALGGPRGMIEASCPFIGFTVAWLVSSDLMVAIITALAVAVLLAILRLAQKQSLKYVAQAIFPTAIAVVVAARTGRAEDAFLPGILYNGALAVVFAVTIVIGRPVIGYLYGAAVGDPSGWTSDPGLVRLFRRLTAILAVPYVLRFVIQLPIFLSGHVVLLGVAKVVLGWPLLLLALAAIGVLLARGRTPISEVAAAGISEEPAAGTSGGTAAGEAGVSREDPGPLGR